MKPERKKILFLKSAAFFIVGQILVASVSFQISGQKRGKTYNVFDHNVAAHRKQTCAECHKSPTGLTTDKTASGEKYRFPDITDYPEHASCTDCHRQQFFRGAKPAICSVCHTKVSPRAEARFSFPTTKRGGQFTIRFSHEVHQDIIADSDEKPKRNEIAAAHFVNVKFSFSGNLPDDKKPAYNNCAICHAPSEAKNYTTVARPPQLVNLEKGIVAPSHTEKIPAPLGYFRNLPNGHASCFNCHYSEQKPVRTDCAGCHIASRNRIAESVQIERTVLKFNHDSQNVKIEKDEKTGEEIKRITYNHPQECVSCHLRITQSADLRKLNPDVPIFTCATSSCHSTQLKQEISRRDSKEITNCSYCHGNYIGSFQIPDSHRAIK